MNILFISFFIALPPFITVLMQAMIHKKRGFDLFCLYAASINFSILIFIMEATFIRNKEIYQIVKMLLQKENTDYILISVAVSTLNGFLNFDFPEERTLFEKNDVIYSLYYLSFLFITANYFMISQFGYLHLSQAMLFVLRDADQDEFVYVKVFVDLCVIKTVLFTLYWVFTTHNLPNAIKFGCSGKEITIPINKTILLAVVFLFSTYTFFTQTCFREFINTYDTFIQENYVFPDKVNMTWPEKKRNLLFIFLESIESSFSSKEYNGFFDENMIPLLTKIGMDPQNTQFSDTDSFGGGIPTSLATWSIAGAFSMLAGLPFKASYNYISRAFPRAQTALEILNSQGYDMIELQTFANKFFFADLFLEHTPNIDFYDCNRVYKVHPEFEVNRSINYDGSLSDYQTFQMAEEIIQKRVDEKKEKPFAFFMTTGSTHFPDGYPSSQCPRKHDYKYYDAMQCADQDIFNFLESFKRSPVYNDTTIILVGDHLSSSGRLKHIMEDFPRKIYDLVINPAYKPPMNITKNREFLAFDWFPTILASIGVKIDGERLGLGTNLFSGKKTLSEIYTSKYVNNKVLKPSIFFKDNFCGMEITDIPINGTATWE